MNGSQQSGDRASGLSSGQATPTASGDITSSASVRGSAGSSNLATVRELPARDENDVDANEVRANEVDVQPSWNFVYLMGVQYA